MKKIFLILSVVLACSLTGFAQDDAKITSLAPDLYYSFETSDYKAPAIGTLPLEYYVKGNNNTIGTPWAEGDPVPVAVAGPTATKKAVTVPANLFVKVGLPAGGSLSAYTCLIDIRVRELKSKISLFSEYQANNQDPKWHIYADGSISKEPNTSKFSAEEDTYYRVVFTTGSTSFIYVNGTEIYLTSDGVNINDFFWLFTDNNGELGDIDCSGIAFWAKTLTPAEVKELGAPAPALPYAGTAYETPYGQQILPGAIEAEWFDNGGAGVAYHVTQPVDGNENTSRKDTEVSVQEDDWVGEYITVHNGDWLKYTVEVEADEQKSYSAVMTVLSLAAGGKVKVFLDDALIEIGELAFPVAEEGQEFFTSTVTLDDLVLPVGKHVLRFRFNTTGEILFADIIIEAYAYQGTPFNGPHTVPCITEAEDFDNGGDGVAYHEMAYSSSAARHQYRPTELIDIEAGDEKNNGTGFHIGNTNPGEWTKYTINVPADAAGNYTFSFTWGRPTPDVHFFVSIDDDEQRDFIMPVTASYEDYETKDYFNAYLSAGTHVVRVDITKGNFDKFEIKKLTAGTPYKTHAIPGVIQAEDFDLGGEGLGFHKKTTASGNGVAYRTDEESAPVVIAEGPGSDNFKVASLTQDEWLTYTFDVSDEAAGTYDMISHGTSGATGFIFIYLDEAAWGSGELVYGTQEPGKYQVTSGGITQRIYQELALTAGTHVFKIKIGSDNTMEFDRFELVKRGSTPFTDYPESNGAAQVIPGLLEAEYFDNGGSCVAYWVADPSLGGSNNSIRQTEGVPIGYDDEYDYTYITLKNLEWTKYSVNIEKHASYDLTFETEASANGSVWLYFDNELIGTADINTSEGWGYQILPSVELGDGVHEIRIIYKGEGEIKVSSIFTEEHIVPQPKYVYDFEDASDLQKASIGDRPLVFYNAGDRNPAEGGVGEPDLTLIPQIDGPTPGDKAILVPLTAKIKVVLDDSEEILPAEQRHNRYTMLWDIQRAETSIGKYICLYQNRELNIGDGALFINSNSMASHGRFAGIGLADNNKAYGTYFCEVDEPWYRIIFVSNGDSHRIYIDGLLVNSQPTSNPTRFTLGNYFWLFGDDNGECHEVSCAKFAFWDESVGFKDLEDAGFGGSAYTAIKKVETPTGKVYAENGKLHVEGFSASASVEVYNLVGQKITAAKSLNGKTLDVPNKALYIVKVTDKGKSVSYKVIVK